MGQKVVIYSADPSLDDYQNSAAAAVKSMGLAPLRQFKLPRMGESGGNLKSIVALVGILAYDYGLPQGRATAPIEVNYDHARRLGITRMMYVVDSNYPWTLPLPEQTPDSLQRLGAFRARLVKDGTLRDTFTTPDDLAEKVANDLDSMLTNSDANYRTRRKIGRWRRLVSVGLIVTLLITLVTPFIVLKPDQISEWLKSWGIVREPAVPVTTPTAVVNGSEREILILVADFEQLNNSNQQPSGSWERMANRAVGMLPVNSRVRVHRINQVIPTTDLAAGQRRAQEFSDAYQATLVIWGSVDNTFIETHYTTTPRWSYIESPPPDSVFRADGGEFQLETFISLGGDNDYILNFVIGQLLYFDLQYEAAREAFNQALGHLPAGREGRMGVAQVYFYLGNLDYVMGRGYDAAIALYRKAIEIQPDYVDVLVNRAILHRSLTQYDLALADLDSALAVDPDSVTVRANKGELYSQLGEYNKAIDEFSAALQQFEDDPVEYFVYGDTCVCFLYSHRGDAYSHIGEYDKAQRDFWAAEALNPRYTDTYYYRGVAYWRKGEYQKAVDDLTHLIEMNGADYVNSFTYYIRGDSYYRLGRYDEAINDFSRTVDMNPDEAVNYYNRGLAYKFQGQNQEAIDDFTRAIELDPAYANVYTERGWLYDVTSQEDKALEDANQAIELNPDDLKAYLLRANLYYGFENYSFALRDYNHILDVSYEYASAIWGIGNIDVRQERYTQAMAQYQNYVQLTGDNANKLVLDRITQLDTLETRRKDVEASPESAGAHGSLGHILYDLGNYVPAIASYDRAIELYPEDKNAYWGRGNAYYQLKYYGQALSDYHRYLELAREEASETVIERVRALEMATLAP